MLQLDTENADRNLTSLVTVLTHTPSASLPLRCQALVNLGDEIKRLDGTGGDFQVVVTVGGQTIQPSPQTLTFSTAVRASFFTAEFPVPAGAEVVVRVLSPNAADTDVDVTAFLYDVLGGKIAATIAAGDIATDAITAAAVKADAVTKLQAGLARPTSDIPSYHVITPGATSRMIEVPMRSATTGLLVGSLAYDDMTIYYYREGEASAVACSSIADGSAGTWGTEKWAATGITGIYQFGIPNAALEAGANAVTFVFSHASAATTLVRILLATVQTGDGYAYLGTNLGALGANATEAGGTGDHLTAIAALIQLGTTSAAVNDESAEATSFVTTLTEATPDHYNGGVLVFTSGALLGQARRISDYAGDTKTITLESALTEAPADEVTFIILGRIEA